MPQKPSLMDALIVAALLACAVSALAGLSTLLVLL
jgi:hypothetical protein